MNPHRQAYKNKKSNAKKRGIPFTLTASQFYKLRSQTLCFYSAIPLTHTLPNKSPRLTDWTLDRVDASQGYTKDNCVACSHAANFVKNFCYEIKGEKQLGNKEFAHIFHNVRYQTGFAERQALTIVKKAVAPIRAKKPAKRSEWQKALAKSAKPQWV